MDDSNQEECEDENENPTPLTEFRRNRCRLEGSLEATRVYIDLLHRASQMIGATEDESSNRVEQNSVVDSDTTNSNRASISQPISNQEATESNELRQISETETESDTGTSEPFILISPEDIIQAINNHPFVVRTGPPPSYTSLPPTVPAMDQPPIIHPPPPPSYEQTFGLRYLDRDQPVLVFNTDNMWGYRPQLAYCISCNAMVLTNIHMQYCHATHIVAILSFLFCCWPCCVLPYFIPALKEAHHHCPACNSHLGTYHPFTRTI